MNGTAIQKERGYVIQGNIKKWGNSQGIRLSKEILSQMDLKENDAIEIMVQDGKMTIEKLHRPKYQNLTDRLEEFYQKPIEEIYVESAEELETGAPKGNELW